MMKHILLVTLILILSGGLNIQAKSPPEIISLKVTENGFEPSKIDVKPGTDVVLKVTRTTDSTCATQIQVPSKKLKVDLPLNKRVELALGILKKGEVRFGCGMGMMVSGQILVQ